MVLYHSSFTVRHVMIHMFETGSLKNTTKHKKISCLFHLIYFHFTFGDGEDYVLRRHMLLLEVSRIPWLF